jgi:glycosyltransferase involved in cell wall biosynthesis
MRACVLTTVHIYNDNRIFFKQIPTLLRAGYQVTYIAPCPPEVSYLKGIDLIPLPQIPRSRRPLNWGRALGAALQTRADIFHFHDPELIGVGLLLKLLTHRPVVYDIHENYPQVMLNRLWIPAGFRPAVAKGMNLLEWLAARIFDGVVVANEPTYGRFQRANRRPVLVRNFVDLHSFDEAQESAPLKLEAPYFIYSGLLSRDRGALDCLAAFERLSGERKDAGLVLVGRLDDADPSVANLSHRLPREAYLLPEQPFRRLPPLLKGARAGMVTLYPTPNYLEILPTKLLEYMAASIPVIAYNLPLVRPIVEEASCGLLVEPGDIEQMAKAMAHILNHPTEAREMGRRGREAVVERYSWEREGKKLIGLYRGLLGQGAPNPAGEAKDG